MQPFNESYKFWLPVNFFSSFSTPSPASDPHRDSIVTLISRRSFWLDVAVTAKHHMHRYHEATNGIPNTSRIGVS